MDGLFSRLRRFIGYIFQFIWRRVPFYLFNATGVQAGAGAVADDKEKEDKAKPETEPWQEEKVTFLTLPIEERRTNYRCGHNYVTLAEVPTWAEYFNDNELWLRKIAEGKICELESIEPEMNDKVSIWRGDITTLEIDVIVNAANKTLLGGGGVDGAIHRAAGSTLVEECATLDGCDTGNAKLTGGYRLPAKYIAHTVGPIEQGDDELIGCYQNSLNLMKNQGQHSIAFPCISTGIYGFPNERAADIALKTARKFIQENKNEVDRVIFCLFLPLDVEIYERLMQKYFPVRPEDPRPQHELNPDQLPDVPTDVPEDVPTNVPTEVHMDVPAAELSVENVSEKPEKDESNDAVLEPKLEKSTEEPVLEQPLEEANKEDPNDQFGEENQKSKLSDEQPNREESNEVSTATDIRTTADSDEKADDSIEASPQSNESTTASTESSKVDVPASTADEPIEVPLMMTTGNSEIPTQPVDAPPAAEAHSDETTKTSAEEPAEIVAQQSFESMAERAAEVLAEQAVEISTERAAESSSEKPEEVSSEKVPEVVEAASEEAVGSPDEAIVPKSELDISKIQNIPAEEPASVYIQGTADATNEAAENQPERSEIAVSAEKSAEKISDVPEETVEDQSTENNDFSIRESEPIQIDEAVKPQESGTSKESEISKESGSSMESAIAQESETSKESEIIQESGTSEASATSHESGSSKESEVSPESGASKESEVSQESGASNESEVSQEPGATKESTTSPESGTSKASVTSQDSGNSNESTTPQPMTNGEQQAEADAESKI